MLIKWNHKLNIDEMKIKMRKKNLKRIKNDEENFILFNEKWWWSTHYNSQYNVFISIYFIKVSNNVQSTDTIHDPILTNDTNKIFFIFFFTVPTCIIKYYNWHWWTNWIYMEISFHFVAHYVVFFIIIIIKTKEQHRYSFRRKSVESSIKFYGIEIWGIFINFFLFSQFEKNDGINIDKNINVTFNIPIWSY